MKKANNIYNYEPPKSTNEETHLLLTKGRITVNTFALRLFFTSIIVALSLVVKFYTGERYNYFIYSVLIICFVFILIQAVKRLHDSNKSGWYILIPFYNIYLFFIEGTYGGNNFGTDPRPQKDVTYFDELEEKTPPEPSKKPILVGLISLLLLLAIFIWWYNRTITPPPPPIEKISADTTKKSEDNSLPIAVNCNEFSRLFSLASQLMNEKDFRKKEEALSYFAKAKGLMDNGCNNPRNIAALEKKVIEYQNQAKNAESGYKILSNQEKKDSVGEILSNRIKYFQRASTILATSKK